MKQMKRYFLTIIMVILTSAVFAQNPIPKGTKQLNLGVGLSTWGIPIYAGLDFGIGSDISLGFEATYRAYDETWTNNKYKHSVIGFSGNGNYHFNRIMDIPSNWDFYAGLNVGFYVWKSQMIILGPTHQAWG
jgi:outer membrane immunogenic protein